MIKVTQTDIRETGQRLATELRGEPRALSILEEGRLIIKDAFAQGKLLSYRGTHRKISRETITGCAGAVVSFITDSGSFFALSYVNNLSPHDPVTGVISDMSYIEAALEVAREELTK